MEKPNLRQIDSWNVAEQNARDWMRYWGYRDASLTPPGADAGIDVRSSRALAQVKYEARDVGRPQLQLLVGARGRNHHAELLFFTGAGYSTQATEYAAEMGIALFKYSLDGRPKPVNPAAQAIVSRAEADAESARRASIKAAEAATIQRTDSSSGAGPRSKKSRAKFAVPTDTTDLIVSCVLIGLALGLAVFLFYLGFGPVTGFFSVLLVVLGLATLLFAAVGVEQTFFKEDPDEAGQAEDSRGPRTLS